MCAPPPIYSNNGILTTTVVKDSQNAQALTPFKSIMIGDHSATVVAYPRDSIISAMCQDVEVLAVVQPYVIRKELTVFNIEYAADAQFNLEPNQ